MCLLCGIKDRAGHSEGYQAHVCKPAMTMVRDLSQKSRAPCLPLSPGRNKGIAMPAGAASLLMRIRFQAEGVVINLSACLVVEELEDICNVIRDALVACKHRACESVSHQSQGLFDQQGQNIRLLLHASPEPDLLQGCVLCNASQGPSCWLMSSGATFELSATGCRERCFKTLHPADDSHAERQPRLQRYDAKRLGMLAAHYQLQI